MQMLIAAELGPSLQEAVLDGVTLQYQDRGIEVEELQEALGFLSPDGVFGPATEGSILRLQEAMNLPATGVLDGATLLALAELRTRGSQSSLLFLHQSSGAGDVTASQTGMDGGPDASVAMADEDEARVLPYLDVFKEVAEDYDLPAPVLMAIASRESRGGTLLDDEGYSIYDGRGFGLMQVDRGHHTPAGGPTSREHIEQAAEILLGMRNSIVFEHPDWTPSEQLRGAICAYNTGPSGIETVGGMDQGTTGQDYSSDVWVRAQRYARLFNMTLS
jgi:peptidoglycan hydrolase-like protein with peptidoglycan-binding domain